jgi:hypothetical protein
MWTLCNYVYIYISIYLYISIYIRVKKVITTGIELDPTIPNGILLFQDPTWWLLGTSNESSPTSNLSLLAGNSRIRDG